MPDPGSQLAVGHDGHAVHFYGDDQELAVSAAQFLGDGLAAGGSAVVVATAAHRLAVQARLRSAIGAGRLLAVDAGEMLHGFLDGGRLDGLRFRQAAEGLIGRAARTGQPVRIYAEMVALLWDAGQVALALELEGLWNDLAARLPFSLLCGYPAGLLADADQADAVRRMSGLHSSVIAAGPAARGARGGAVPDGQATAGKRSFPFELDSIQAARHFVTGTLAPTADDALVDDAAIVATELAANAVLHAGSAFTVTVSASAALVRIAVRDEGLLTPTSGDDPFEVRQDHGLGVVSRIASGWAVERLPDGKVVWAELDASGLNASAA